MCSVPPSTGVVLTRFLSHIVEISVAGSTVKPSRATRAEMKNLVTTEQYYSLI